MKIKEPLLEKLKKELAILCAMATISVLLINISFNQKL